MNINKKILSIILSATMFTQFTNIQSTFAENTSNKIIENKNHISEQITPVDKHHKKNKALKIGVGLAACSIISVPLIIAVGCGLHSCTFTKNDAPNNIENKPITDQTIDKIVQQTKSILQDEYRHLTSGENAYHNPDNLNDYCTNGVPTEMHGTVYHYSNKFLTTNLPLKPDYINTHIANTVTAFLSIEAFEKIKDQMVDDIYNSGLSLAQQYDGGISTAEYVSPDHYTCCTNIYSKVHNLYHINEDVRHFANGYQLYTKLNQLYQTTSDRNFTYFLIVEDKNSYNAETRFHVRVMHANDIYF